MILADTSVWVDHLKSGDAAMAARLQADELIMHPFVIGEIALGSMRNRQGVLRALQAMKTAMVATHDEVMALIDAHRLWSRGVGYVDVHLLVAVRLAPGTLKLWTRDRRLLAVAEELGVAHQER